MYTFTFSKIFNIKIDNKSLDFYIHLYLLHLYTLDIKGEMYICNNHNPLNNIK